MKTALLLCLLCVSPALAELSVSPLFQGGAVLQQGGPVPVWGVAEPGAAVEVRFGNTPALSTTAGGDGRWMVKLPPMEKSTEPAELHVTSGDEKIACENILVGEVWLCSGQSNTAFPLRNSERADEVLAEVAAGEWQHVRLFKKVPKAADEPVRDVPPGESWKAADKETIGGFSACGIYFARRLVEDLKDTPIGLLQAAVGGTNAHCWIPNAVRDEGEAGGVTREWYAKQVEAHPAALERYEQAKIAHAEKVKTAKAAGEKPPRAPRPPIGPGALKRPSGLYNGTVAPLQPYALRGALWYQGEGNSREPFANNYKNLMHALADGWRSDWSKAAGADAPYGFSFHTVQLPAFGRTGHGWSLVQEKFLQLADADPLGQTAITIDSGAEKDIHPKDKHIPGSRLALVALHHDYGFTDLAWSGPRLLGSTPEEGALRLHFDHLFGGLKSSDGKPLRHFEVAGEDDIYHPAEATIDGKTILLKSPKVAAPRNVRYAWKGWPEGGVNFFNKAGLPATPFRSDPTDLPAG